MSDVIVETDISKFASKDCCEMHDLCLFFYNLKLWKCSFAKIYVDAKGINISKAAFEITGYSCCSLNQKAVSTFSLNSVSCVESSLVFSINCSFAALEICHISKKYKMVILPNNIHYFYLNLENIQIKML